QMHVAAVWIAEMVKPAAVVEPVGIDHEGIAVPSANGVTQPFQVIGVLWKRSPVCPDFTIYTVPFENLNHSARSLEDFHRPIRKKQYARYSKGIAHAGWIVSLRRRDCARAV